MKKLNSCNKCLLASLLFFLILINHNAIAGFKKQDTTYYTKNYLKFSPFSFVPYNLLPCAAIDFEHRHNNYFSSQITGGLYIPNDAHLNSFPGFKAAYEAKIYLNKEEALHGYLSFNSTFISQTGMRDLTFVAAGESTMPTNSRYNERVKIHRDIFLNSLRLGIQFSIGKKLAVDAFMGLGFMSGHNIHYNRSQPDDHLLGSDILPIPLTFKNGDFSSITFPWNIKLCYKLNN
ncbi:MAG: hypothetical protein NT150_00565 [Bacteroidetes bacterium]|nr:hypothetical protein [Bacteroidota bacterium]